MTLLQLMKNRSLRFKLITMTLSLTFVLSFASWQFTAKFIGQIESSLLESYGNHASSISDAIGAQYFERYGDVQAFALNSELYAGPISRVTELLDNYSALYGIYDLIVITDTQGRIVAVTSKSPTGKPINSAKLVGKSVADSAWFKNTIQGKFTEDKAKGFVGTFVEDFAVDPLSTEVYGEPMIQNSFSAQLKDQSGQVVGVILNRAGIRWLESCFLDYYLKLKAQGFGSTEITFLNHAGQVFVDYDPSSNNGDLTVPHNLETLFKLNLAEKGVAAAKDLVAGKVGTNYSLHARKQIEQMTGYTPVMGSKFTEDLKWNILVRTSKKEMLASLNQIQLNFYLVFGTLILLSIGISLFFSSSLSKDLSILASGLAKNATQVSEVAGKVAASSSELSSSSTEQAAALQETVASIDQISAMASKNSDNANRSLESSRGSQNTVLKGQEVVSEMLHAIEEIDHANGDIMKQVEVSNSEIANIVKVIKEIGTKTNVINDIVFQTKLLSFNASVEAARAGEHGKGFAVVAEEVGNLAQMSGNAAKEISDMLESSIRNVESIAKEMQTGVGRLVLQGKAKVQSGVQTAQRCKEMLNQIVKNVSEVDSMVAQIASASQEQSVGINEVTKAMNQMDQANQQNTTATQETADAAELLRTQAASVHEIVEALLKTVEGIDSSPSKHVDTQDGSENGNVIPFPGRHVGGDAIFKKTGTR